MFTFISFTEVAGAIFISFAVALTLQWIGLVWLMRLMPGRPVESLEEVAGRGAHRKLSELSVARERKNAA
jgi:hypothetical protein